MTRRRGRGRGLGKRYRLGAPPGAVCAAHRVALRTRSGARSDAGTARSRVLGAAGRHLRGPRRARSSAIIGRNGAGKTTLLKILSRITEPTEGTATLRGRVGSLLEVGTGFHPELTGRENIYLNGAILGMRRAEIRRQFDEIVDFAEVERFLDTPVKRYSSGMQVRLGFAVAAHLEPEILVVDEVLAVGDAAFQQKCLGKMEDVGARRPDRPLREPQHGGGREPVHTWPSAAARTSRCDRPDRRGGRRLPRQVDRPIDARPRRAHGSTGQREVAFHQPLRGVPDGHGCGDRCSDIGPSRACRHVDVSIGLFTRRGEGAAYLSNAMSGARLGTLPDRGTISCSIDAMHAAARYAIASTCIATVSGRHRGLGPGRWRDRGRRRRFLRDWPAATAGLWLDGLCRSSWSVDRAP